MRSTKTNDKRMFTVSHYQFYITGCGLTNSSVTFANMSVSLFDFVYIVVFECG